MKEYSPNEIASLFNVNPDTVYHWITAGILPATKKAGRWKCSKNDVTVMVENQRKRGRFYALKKL